MGFRQLSCVIVATVLAGCAESRLEQIRRAKATGAPLAPPPKVYSKSVPPLKAFCTAQPTKALFCLYRNQVEGRSSSVDLQLKGHTVAQVPNDTFVELSVPPGLHELTVFGRVGNPSSMTFDVAAGSVTFLRVEMEAIAGLVAPELKEKSKAEASVNVTKTMPRHRHRPRHAARGEGARQGG